MANNMQDDDKAKSESQPIVIKNVVESTRSRAGCGQIFSFIGGTPYRMLVPFIIGFVIVIVAGFVLNYVGSLIGYKPPTASIVNSRTILTGIQPMGQLVSLSVQLAKANITVGVEQRGVLNNNLCGYAATYVAQGTIRAGTDLTQLSEDSIFYNETDQIYEITLPAVQLTSCSIDYIDQYVVTTTLCPGIDWDETRQLASYQALQDFKSDALENQVTTRAEQQVSLVVSNFTKALTGKDVSISFEESSTSASDITCEPMPPVGWTFDTVAGVWIKSQ